MEKYLVGGCVRDALLHLQPKDFDWVVLGATPEEMLQKGFKQVGRSFPVFLHPETQEEYALARIERPCGLKHTDFVVLSHPNVTLKEDLMRRDFTINAIAKRADESLYDPFHGVCDLLQHKIFRHISDAFADDALRILRLARFSTMPWAVGFSIAKETQQKIAQMVANKSLLAISQERIWIEFYKALAQERFHRFFEVLFACKALKQIFPQALALFTAQGEMIKSVKELLQKAPCPRLRYAFLAYSFVTHLPTYPLALGQNCSLASFEALQKALGAPKSFAKYGSFASQQTEFLNKVKQFPDKNGAKFWISRFYAWDAFRDPSDLLEKIMFFLWQIQEKKRCDSSIVLPSYLEISPNFLMMQFQKCKNVKLSESQIENSAPAQRTTLLMQKRVEKWEREQSRAKESAL